MEIRIGSNMIVGAIKGIRNLTKKSRFEFKDDAIVCPDCGAPMRLINRDAARYEGFDWMCPECPYKVSISPKEMAEIRSKIRLW